MNSQIQAIVGALSTLRMPAQPGEYDIHGAVDEALTGAGLSHQHEYKLGPRCRIDFVVGRVGLEIKKGRPAASALQSQLKRYLAHDDLEAVVVLTQRALHLPDQIGGKPVYLVSLNRLWGVALP